jgi:uncharacterized protein (DUF433 family)
MSTIITDLGKLIDRNPSIHNGRPLVAGTGVTVNRIVIWYKQGYSPEQIADEIIHLNLAQLYAALAYYHLHQSEMESEMVMEEAEAKEIETLHQKLIFSGEKK